MARDPRTIARKYQLDMCKKAVEENTIVYLGTGCGKTHIALLLMHELAHLFRKPKSDVCVFLAPTVPLVRQQAIVIESSTEFKVQMYYGNFKHLKTHDDWERELQEYEVLVMTPQILLHNLRHCFIRMELITLLVFDECHHAQLQKRHPYAQIMKEFYGTGTSGCPRIFGMTASPVIGKGGNNRLDYAKCINSLEQLLDSKVCTVEEDIELENIVASSEVMVYYYQRFSMGSANVIAWYVSELEKLKDHFTSIEREKSLDSKAHKKFLKLLWGIHSSLIFCLDNIGLWGTLVAARILLNTDSTDLMGTELESRCNDGSVLEYLNGFIAILNCKLSVDALVGSNLPLGALEEPFFSKRLLVLIDILHKYKETPNIRCIVFVKRIIVAKSLTYILKNVECLDFLQCDFLVGFHSGSMSRNSMNKIVQRFSAGEVNLLIATNVAEEGLDIQTCCLVIRFDLPETVASYIQSRGRARMSNSEYVFIVERGNEREEKLLKKFKWSEDAMNKEIVCRTSTELFDRLEEATYGVDSTGASISTGCSVSLLHRYCSKLPHDEYFNPVPKFFFIDDTQGSVCRLVLPSNSPVRHIDSDPMSSRDKAKRSACLKACVELHNKGALSDFLLPDFKNSMKSSPALSGHESAESEDDSLKEELHEMYIPTVLNAPWMKSDNCFCLHFYYICFIPIPEDREYQKFGLFLKSPLPREAEHMEVDLHLAHGRIVRTRLIPLGMSKFNAQEIALAERFQMMSLKVVLDRTDMAVDFVTLECQNSNLAPRYYLFLPMLQHASGIHMNVDWKTVQICLSSPAFSKFKASDHASMDSLNTLHLANGRIYKEDVVNSFVYVPISGVFYFIDGIFEDMTGYSNMWSHKALSYYEYYKYKFSYTLLNPGQPLLKAKQLFVARNLLCNRLQNNTDAHELQEHFVELPPEICQLKVIQFSKSMGSSLSLLPSFMHRLENLLVAIELKSILSSSFSEGSEITAHRVLEALTTEKCLERFSLERLEILGDAFLKYAVGRHTFLSYDALDEGRLTNTRSRIVNNSHLYELAVKKHLQVYIRDEVFNPTNIFTFGRPSRIFCNEDTKSSPHFSQQKSSSLKGSEFNSVKCSKNHHWLCRKTIADVVEALVGAFLVDSGFKAAVAFLKWLGIEAYCETALVKKAFEETRSTLSLINSIDVASIEKRLGYFFQHKGLLIQAFIHPSYTKHLGGCYQRLEFLGDAVMEYLITSYVFSAYPELKPGHLSDLRSISVNNNALAQISVQQHFHECLITDSKVLAQAIKLFGSYVLMPDSQQDLTEEPAVPKVLGDIVESCIGAVLLDSGFNMNCVWRVMLALLNPVLKFSGFHISPIRELMELCQFCGFQLSFHPSLKNEGLYLVKVNVDVKDKILSCFYVNHNSKAAKRMAAQEMISILKALGYKHKGKSLEDVLLTTRKEKPNLIGFDEEPILVNIVNDDICLEKLHVKDSQQIYMPNVSCLTPSSEEVHISSVSFTSVPKATPEPANGKSIIREEVEKLDQSVKSRLFEICSAHYWNPPSFVCCMEEGPSHLKMFTYKVTVEMGGSVNTTLECFGEPCQKKKGAQELAAKGAIWYLAHQGYAQVA